MIRRGMKRRQFFKECLVLAAGSRLGLAQRRRLDEYDPANTKIAHRVSARISDDDLLFLKQIGMRWARVEVGEGDTPFEMIRAMQEEFARFDSGIYSGVHYGYRTLNVQLGRPGRDRDIQTYCTFLRGLERLGIPIAS